jgi:hypothetical protein
MFIMFIMQCWVDITTLNGNTYYNLNAIPITLYYKCIIYLLWYYLLSIYYL